MPTKHTHTLHYQAITSSNQYQKMRRDYWESKYTESENTNYNNFSMRKMLLCVTRLLNLETISYHLTDSLLWLKPTDRGYLVLKVFESVTWFRILMHFLVKQEVREGVWQRALKANSVWDTLHLYTLTHYSWGFQPPCLGLVQGYVYFINLFLQAHCNFSPLKEYCIIQGSKINQYREMISLVLNISSLYRAW